MTRARATALALVNWKGVFYERYLLDRHVTALEGANGAGKTTVMIAAYVVLLPDMTRLRFTNLGESGATGGDKGVWGRLGAVGRPSYAAMEIELAGGERIVAGVALRRKAEPTLELEPFVVSGANLEGRLRELLLVTDGADEMVPELDELRANAEKLGARLEAFASAKDYFATLFDRGVTPLRMGTDEERNKVNEMLRTSMTGGISRALTTDLRAFLLKEETGLGDTLSRMRANLDACHRTRIEVVEARRLERELVGVYDAGRAMFAAATLAARAAAEEHTARVEQARTRRDDAIRAARHLEATAAEGAARHAVSKARLEGARVAHDEAVALAERAVRAQALTGRIRDLEPELEAAREGARAARAEQDTAAGAREARRQLRDASATDCDRAARGLADLQGGLEELHRRVQARRHALRRLEEARDALDDPTLDVASAEDVLERSRAALRTLDERRAQLAGELESAGVRSAEHARALDALRAIAGDVDAPGAHERAREELARLSGLEAGQARVADLAAERRRSAELAGRQAVALERAAALGVGTPAAHAARVVEGRVTEAEAAMRAAEDAAHAEGARADDARRARDEARRRTMELDHAAARWRAVATIVERLEAALGMPVRTREAVAAARARLAQAREGARVRAAEGKRQRDELLKEAAALQSPAEAMHPDLLRLRDELDAERLASRFEDLDPAEAARVEAVLGPLVDALVVVDPAAAARKLAGRPRELGTVWLVAAGTATPDEAAPAGAGRQSPEPEAPATTHATQLDAAAREAPATDAARDVVVTEALAVRVTRLPALPTLGRRAREQRAADARAKSEVLAAETADAARELRETEALSRDADRLLEEGALLDAGDPAAALAETRARAEAAAATERACVEAVLAARERAAASRALVEKLRALLGEAFLLEPVDHAARARELSETLALAAAAADELQATAAARRTLGLLLDALRVPPPDDQTRASQTGARQELDRARDRVFRACEALDDVVRGRDALASGDLEGTLAEQGAVSPALEAQLAGARQTMSEHERALRAAEASWEAATAAAQRAAARREAVEAQVARLRGELVAEGPIAAVAAVDAQHEVSRLRGERAALEALERSLATEGALLAERVAQAARAVGATERDVTAEEQAAGPAGAHWAQVTQRMEAEGVVRDAFAARSADAYEGRSSAALGVEARGRAAVLVDRLAASPGGAECVDRVREAEGGASTEAFFQAWLAVRDWIKRRLPAPLGELPEPVQALDRLRNELESLEERLARQDTDLRGTSEDVARGIDVQLRRASHQVRRLNQHLEGVKFGSITGIRVQMRRIDRMQQVLTALREGAAQELLFRPTMPIEEALDEIFRRYGGGRGGGSNRVLDYREYAELGVEIRRHDRGEWESASPTRLSTGEAIGVGAALMMVILTEWERDANLLRARRGGGSLRFLFLDEANRLSQDNLAVLFDLCKSLDLQLLIAAPEVARADGNTTYRLVRRVTSDGREEVLVSGRRTVGADART